ncbi:MAG: phosphotransferase [Acidimicrobiales bacterium]
MGAIAGLEHGIPENPLDLDATWMTTILRTSGAIDEATTVASVESEPFQVGVGLLGQLARASMSYEAGDGPATVILKYPIDVPHQRGMADGINAYEREVRFYREIAPASELRTPAAYAAMIAEDKTDSLVVMEDLSHLRQADRANGVSWDEAVASVRTLARFHAQWHESDRLSEMAGCWYALGNPIYNVVLPQFIDAAWESCQVHGAQFLDDEIVAFGNRWVELFPAMQKQLMTSPTLVHGDWRADNMFIDGGDVVIVDFQIVGVANGAYDLAYFICQSVEREVRAGRERELVDHYVAALSTAGVTRDADQVWFDLRVAAGLCLIYGIVSYAQYELLPGEGQHVIDTILRRSTQGITDVGAIEAVNSLASDSGGQEQTQAETQEQTQEEIR